MTGDIIGEYAFSKPLAVGDRVIFTDMMQYSFVKNNTFNGVPLPDLAVLSENGDYRVLKSFGYEDFRVQPWITEGRLCPRAKFGL